MSKKRLIMSHIAVWQFMAFMLLLCLVWASEVLDLPALFFKVEPSNVDFFQACLLSAAVFFCALIAIGNTYIQQHHILRGMLTMCPECNKVRISVDAWEDLDSYLEDRTMATLSHDRCPKCFLEMESKIMDTNVTQWRADTKD